MIANMQKYHVLVQQYGIRRCAFRFIHDLKRKHGTLRKKFPSWQWQQRPISSWLRDDIDSGSSAFRNLWSANDAKFFFESGKPPKPEESWVGGAIEEADAVRKGNFKYFSTRQGHLGYPDPDWFLNPFTGQKDSCDQHWCDRGDFDRSRGDIKYIWEPSRFCWAYALVRAYAVTGDDTYPKAFWELTESWINANQPQMGPHWQCGQEISIRLMACVFALYAFSNSPETTDKRVDLLVVMLAASAERIAGNINYARAQMGNHATSEAAALWTVGILFPELKNARQWKELGRFVLEDEARQYCWDDGSYTQHSMNYQRLMLHDYLWSLQLGEVNKEKFSHDTVERLTKSYQFLYQLQESSTGRLPNYGPNDGAVILPLNSCSYSDYRPIIGAMHYCFNKTQLYPVGPWSEDILWLFGKEALDAPIATEQRISKDYNIGGYYTIRDERSFAMMRCHSYRNRPNQADMLHLDLWADGQNILTDSGSYTYYDPDNNWNVFFAGTSAHNTVTVGGADQMIKGPRFQWFSLVRSKMIAHTIIENIEAWQAEHYGYQRLASKAIHRRMVCRINPDIWLVVDDVFGQGSERVLITWNLPDGAFTLKNNSLKMDSRQKAFSISLFCSSQSALPQVARGREGDRKLGWNSVHYGIKNPVPTLFIDVEDILPIRFITAVCLTQASSIESDGTTFLNCRIGSGQDFNVALEQPDAHGKIAAKINCGPETIEI